MCPVSEEDIKDLTDTRLQLRGGEEGEETCWSVCTKLYLVLWKKGW